MRPLRHCLLAVAIAFGVAPAAAITAAAGTTTTPVTVKVVGNHLVNARGRPIVLRGVDRSGMEYACAQGWGLADGPMDQASVDAMARWGVNAVRVPLNEDCWLAINGVKAAYSGSAYRRAVASYVAKLHHDGMVAILDLHWNAPGATLATSQEDMADADHSPAFWKSVAAAFKSDHGVIFDLYNEPHDITWACWADGCTSPGFRTAGMRALLDAVRSTGATQPVMVAPLGWAGAAGGPAQYGTSASSGWLKWHPDDPAHQEILSVHLYNFSGCNAATCWDETIAPAARRFPVVMGEFGETDCASGFDRSLMAWDDAHGVSYLAWAWNRSSDRCGSGGPSLITSYAGAPTLPGAAIEHHYRASDTANASGAHISSVTASRAGAPGAGQHRRSAGVRLRLETLRSWSGGAEQQLVVTDIGPLPVRGPILVPLAVAVRLTGSWNGTLQGAGITLTAVLPAWAPTLAPGRSAHIGFTVSGAPAILRP